MLQLAQVPSCSNLEANAEVHAEHCAAMCLVKHRQLPTLRLKSKHYWPGGHPAYSVTIVAKQASVCQSAA